MLIDISGIDPTAVLFALYSDTHSSPSDLPVLTAEQIAAVYTTTPNRGEIRHFATVGDRPLRVTFHDFVDGLPQNIDVESYDELYGGSGQDTIMRLEAELAR